MLQLIYFVRTKMIRDSQEILELLVKERTKELEEKNKEIEYLANHDTLTGLPSLRVANERLKFVLQMAERKECIASVLFVDLDGFKRINDSYGHDVGDQVLKHCANKITEVIRESDTACRIGGDEFIVILPEVENEEFIGDICQRILAKIKTPIVLDDIEINIGASIGAAYYPKHGNTPQQLKKCADALMYEVKRRGKNDYLIAN